MPFDVCNEASATGNGGGLRAREHEGEEELVPRQDEAQHAGRREAGQRHRQDDAPEGAPCRGAVGHRRPFEINRDALEEAHEDPGEERHVERGIDDGEAGERLREAHRAQDGEGRQHEGHGRQHLQRQDEEAAEAAAGLEAREGIAHGGGERHGEDDRAQ